MVTWIAVSIIGIAVLLIGFVFFSKNYSPLKKIPNSTLILGIISPVFVAFFYSETVFELIPQLTTIDLGVFFIMGMISGFFISILLFQRATPPQEN